MAILSNVEVERFIKEEKIKIDPYEIENVQGATVDFRIGNKFKYPNYHHKKNKSGIIGLEDELQYLDLEDNEIIIQPNHFILGTTLETLTLPNYLCARVDGKSKIGRKGLIVQTAGHIGPGFNGQITLELYNANQMPIKLNYGQKICQIEFHELSSPSTKPYSGQYLGQKGPQV